MYERVDIVPHDDWRGSYNHVTSSEADAPPPVTNHRPVATVAPVPSPKKTTPAAAGVVEVDKSHVKTSPSPNAEASSKMERRRHKKVCEGRLYFLKLVKLLLYVKRRSYARAC